MSSAQYRASSLHDSKQLIRGQSLWPSHHAQVEQFAAPTKAENVGTSMCKSCHCATHYGVNLCPERSSSQFQVLCAHFYCRNTMSSLSKPKTQALQPAGPFKNASKCQTKPTMPQGTNFALEKNHSASATRDF